MRTVITRLGMMAACLLVAASAHAQATRTWVSGVGNDANPCSRTAPCKTFAGAISKTAAGGYISVLDPGGFGAVTITKSLTLDGAGGFPSSILACGTNGIIVSASSIEVTIRNLVIAGCNLTPSADGLNGISVNGFSGVRLTVDNVVIEDFGQKGINFNASSGGFLFVTNSRFEGNTGGGIFVNNARADISGSQFYRNQAAGVQANNGSIVTVTECTASGASEGYAAIGATAVLNLNRSVATHNDFGVVGGTSATVRVNASQVLSNTTNGIFSDGTAAMITFQNNTVQGNPANSAFTQLLNANQ